MELFFLASILSLGFLCVTGTPPQLRLSHSGYEIISFNEQNPDDSSSSPASKLAVRNSSDYNGIGLLNLEKVTDPTDEGDEIPSSVQHHKRHYESQRSNTGSKLTSEIRQNMIEFGSKESLNPGGRHANVYLTVGIPRRILIHPENQRKESTDDIRGIDNTDSKLNNFFDDSNHRRDHANNQEKIIATMLKSKIKDKKYNVKSKIKQTSIDLDKESNRLGDRSTKILESEQESVVNLNKIKALVLDAHRGVDLLVAAKSDSEEKMEKSDMNPVTKSGFPIIGKFPTIQVHNPRNFWLPPKVPAMYSPIYPSGFDVLTGDSRHKSVFPFNLPQPKSPRNLLRFDSKIPSRRINAEIDLEARKNQISHESNELSTGTREILKSWNRDRTNQRVPSFVVIKSMLNSVKDDLTNLRNVNRMSVNLADLVPFAGTSLNVLPLNLKNQRPLDGTSVPTITKHIDHNHPTVDFSMFHQHGHAEDSGALIDAGKTRSRDDDLDSKYFDSKINHRIFKTGLRGDAIRNQVEKVNITSPQPSLLVDVLHEITTDDYESSYLDLDKEETDKVSHEIQDTSRSQESIIARNKCKRMRNLGGSGFYQFLAKFSDTVLENALQYETNLQIRDKAARLIEAGKRKMADDEMSHLI